MTQSLRTLVNNLAADIYTLKDTTQSSLTVAGNDSTPYKLIDEGTVRSLKTQSPLTLTANATDKSLTIGGVPEPSNYATTAALNSKQDQLTFNGDDTVGAQDLAVLLGAWDSFGGPADLNGDGAIGAQDLAILLSAWGACP